MPIAFHAKVSSPYFVWLFNNTQARGSQEVTFIDKSIVKKKACTSELKLFVKQSSLRSFWKVLVIFQNTRIKTKKHRIVNV